MTTISSSGNTSATHERRSLPLERKLPLLILGLLGVVLVVAVTVSYYAVKRSAELTARQRLRSVSQVIGSLVQQQVTARLTVLHRLAADTAVIGSLRHPGTAPSRAAAAALAAATARADSLLPIMLLGPEGIPVGDVRLETPADLEQFSALLRSPESDSGRAGKFYTIGNRTMYWMSVPVRDAGRVIGYVAQQRRFNANPRALQPIHDLIGSDIEMYVRNANDSDWARLDGSRVPPPITVTPPDGGVSVLQHGTDGAALAATTRVAGTPFQVTVEYPVRQVLAGPRATVRVLGVLAILLGVLGALVAWLISRQITRPLVELTQAAEAMAGGEYSHRVHAAGDDEVGRLGAAFNRMAEQVQVSSKASEEAVVRLTRSAATQQFLADASRILAESLSDERLLVDLARYCVPAMSDYCTIQLVDGDGRVRRVETAHYDPARTRAVHALVSRYEYRIDGPGEVPEVIRSQNPLLVPSIDRRAMLDGAPDDATRQLIDDVGPTAFMCVPLVARGRSFGAMSFTMTDSGRSFSHDDLDLAMELARRTAVAIDNSMIYRSSVALRLEAEAASSAKSDFLAKMSHEIRTPINAMMGYAELLEMGISGPVTEAQARQLGRIRASGEHLTALISEILDLAKIEAGRMAVDPVRAGTDEAIEASLGLVRPQAAAKGVRLVSIRDLNGSSEYRGDPQRVQQILTNLLANAVKFTPAGGTVTVRPGTGSPPGPAAARDDVAEWTSIVVEDTGIGIAPEDLERIFQPFVQVENGYTRAHGGTGLGLTISRSLAHMMGGDLGVESTVGEGSRFTLWLPSPN